MQAILTISPDTFFLLSGTGQAKYYPGMYCAANILLQNLQPWPATAAQGCTVSRTPSVLMQFAMGAPCQWLADSDLYARLLSALRQVQALRAKHTCGVELFQWEAAVLQAWHGATASQ